MDRVGKRPYFNANVDCHNALVFFDTGANASLVKSNFIRNLSNSTRIDILHDINPRVVSISGNVVKSRASAKFTFNVNGFSHQLEALIVNDE